MEFSPLTAISPVDGRYHSKTQNLQAYFSEFGLIKYRVHVEVAYFLKLHALGILSEGTQYSKEELMSWVNDFSIADAEAIKSIEKTTNHDVKAVEYFLKAKMTEKGWLSDLEYIHFGLTSQDINNTAIPLSFREAMNKEVYPLLDCLLSTLHGLVSQWKEIPMLARTHGQPASPTRLGKEIHVFVERLQVQYEALKGLPFAAKFGGATGNFNAHYVAYPEHDWVGFANSFVEELGLKRSQTTTQIEHYDAFAAYFDNLRRINTILIDLCRDFWTYISMDYFKQRLKEGEIGSSAMPHKVNPIDFENAEGNLGIANALLEHLSAKLPISRLQRDLTDSTVLRNIGVPIAHMSIAWNAVIQGLNKLLLNETKIKEDLEDNWMVVAEAIQTVLRREKFPQPYEALKSLTRVHGKVTKEVIHSFIDSLDVPTAVKSELKQITPWNYVGIPFLP